MDVAQNVSEHLDDDTVALLADANRAAGRLRHEYIGTEHIVLALAESNADTLPAAFERAGVDRTKLKRFITAIVTSGRTELPADFKRPLTSRTHKSIALAAESARQMGQQRIGPDHLLLGILHEGMSIGAQVLGECGLTVEAATQAISGAGSGDGSPAP